MSHRNHRKHGKVFLLSFVLSHRNHRKVFSYEKICSLLHEPSGSIISVISVISVLSV